MDNELLQLIDAEKKASLLFDQIVENNIIQAGKSEKQVNQEIFELAEKEFGIKKFWHKRIVRAGKNTLLPYQENPPNLLLQKDDILFLDFGPVFEEWEADFGRTYVLGNNPKKIKLKEDTENAWMEGKNFWKENKDKLSGADFYKFTLQLAQKYGWQFGNEHCGHLVGKFPHEKLIGEEKINYIHPCNLKPMNDPDKTGKQRFWIYEIHFIDNENEIGGFFEQLLF